MSHEESSTVSFEPGPVESGSAPITAEADGTAEISEWSVWERLSFRFLVSYFVLYVFPFPVNALPWLDEYLQADKVWKPLTLWVAKSILGVEGEPVTQTTGSGDTVLDYVQLLVSVILALVIAGVWTLWARRRELNSHPVVARWSLAILRLCLAMILLSYGLVKVIPTQMVYPNLARMVTPYGDFSPMGILWSFMGSSPAYTIFAGFGEVVAGVLLLFRRTATLGAAVGAGVMANVAMLNFSYDVPVKLFSTHLLLMCLVILWTDRHRLLAVFWTREAVPARLDEPLVESRRWRLAILGFVVVVVGSLVYQRVDGALSVQKAYGLERPRSVLWGVHDVERFVLDGEELPPLLTDEVRWRALVVDGALPVVAFGTERSGSVRVMSMNGKLHFHEVVLDEENQTLTLRHRPEDADAEPEEDVFDWRRPEEKRLVLTGTWKGQPVEIELVERDLPLLMTRGFRWINEYPYNR